MNYAKPTLPGFKRQQTLAVTPSADQLKLKSSAQLMPRASLLREASERRVYGLLSPGPDGAKQSRQTLLQRGPDMLGLPRSPRRQLKRLQTTSQIKMQSSLSHSSHRGVMTPRSKTKLSSKQHVLSKGGHQRKPSNPNQLPSKSKCPLNP